MEMTLIYTMASPSFIAMRVMSPKLNLQPRFQRGMEEAITFTWSEAIFVSIMVVAGPGRSK